MSDNDLIRRKDALRAVMHTTGEAYELIYQVPAAPTFTVADLERAWQPIETAPKGAPRRSGAMGVSFMLLLHGDLDDPIISIGMRCGDRFYAGSFFYRGGPWDSRQYEIREHEVTPTHWMPLPEPPADLAQRVKE